MANSTVTFDQDLMAIQEMRTVIQKAKQAQEVYRTFTQEQVDRIVEHVAIKAFQASEYLAEMAVAETKMGVKEHKKIKNEVGSMAVFESIKDLKTVGIIHDDKENKVLEIADPYGVVLAIIPTTNPTSTAFFKTIIALKTRNALVVSPHPYAVNCTKAALKVCQDAAIEAGAPPELIQILTYAYMEATSQAMTHPDIDLILATGGSALVKAAYSSGKPAYGVGPGNVPVYVERSAQIDRAAKHIIDSKSFDHGTICATEQAIVVDQKISEIFIQKIKQQGAYMLSDEEKMKMERIISPTVGKVSPKIVGKSAIDIANCAGIQVPSDTRVLVGMETEVGKEIPFSLEKLSPVFALYIATDTDDAKRICNALLDLGGRGHSLSIHTEDDHIARTFALEMPVSRILVNTMSSVGAVGGTTGLKPSMTLGCGSYGGNITSDNVSAEHLINIKRMAYGIREVETARQGTSYCSKKQPQASHTNVQTSASINQIDASLVESIVEKVIQKLS